jgi:hypothetical protein
MAARCSICHDIKIADIDASGETFPTFTLPTHPRADFTSVREKSCPLNKSGSRLDFASA